MPTIFTGASLVNTDNQPGKKQSSLSCWRKKPRRGQKGETRSPCVSCIAPAGMRRNRNDTPTKNRPKANFVGVVGSYFPRRINNRADAGAGRITKITCMETYQLYAKLKPRIRRVV